ncbi:hypothetical protein EKO27_g8122 [Xylaria grammica]|uniref:Uncharacterized protein n=1 Tax=Xylaria grammica TaxID=363999 RepID=A0A439CXR1_9PEZI|nr:hypothetical protein EKO27_g8122 [Xylaria grammica]
MLEEGDLSCMDSKIRQFSIDWYRVDNFLYMARYHWALIVGPGPDLGPESGGMRFHVKEAFNAASVPPWSQLAWAYEERNIGRGPTQMLLVRVVIGKVLDIGRLRCILGRVPVRSEVPGWNCVAWVREAIEEILRDGKVLGAVSTSWEVVRDTAMWYVEQKKRAHRFDGQRQYMAKSQPTWDMLEGKETME